jgi:SAM-dependent methyltransferase
MEDELTNEIIQWDVRTWGRALPVWQRVLDEVRPRTSLAVGERDGGLSLWLALNGVNVLCTDLRELPAGVRALHRRHGVEDRVDYAREDVTALSSPDASFDVVVFKSVIGALTSRDRQAQAIREIHRVLKPGGVLLFAENLTGTAAHMFLRRSVPWSSPWRYLSIPDDLTLFAPFGLVEWQTTGFLAALGRSETQRAALARLDSILCRVVPASWQYVLYGACTKQGSGSAD